MRFTLPLSVTLISSVIVQLACQAFKVILYSIRDRKLSLSYFISAGGMPSAHSAFVTALSVSVGLWNGFDSDLFAVSVVFSLIVIYDAIRLRGAVAQHARALNRLAAGHPEAKLGRLTEMVGHSIGEIMAGLVAGGGFALLTYLIFARLLA
jgi:acid phosphatase family membrane protein YuiD